MSDSKFDDAVLAAISAGNLSTEEADVVVTAEKSPNGKELRESVTRIKKGSANMAGVLALYGGSEQDLIAACVQVYNNNITSTTRAKLVKDAEGPLGQYRKMAKELFERKQLNPATSQPWASQDEALEFIKATFGM